MNTALNRVLLFTLVVIGSLTVVQGQTPTVTLSNGNPAGRPEDAFDGNVFQAGSQIGDATLYAVLSGGAQSFQIVSPGESLTRTVVSNGLFSIRPTGSLVVDKSKILNFTGTVTGSVAITVKPLSITTLSANVVTETAPGSELTISYLTGAGTFPVDLAIGKFKVQLLDAAGNLLGDLLNSADQYTATERFGVSKGGTRFIKATLPATIPSGTYRVRVITLGLITPVVGSPSPVFSVRDNSPVIGIGSVGSGNFCAGITVSFPFSTTGTFPAGNQFKIRLANATGTTIQDLTESGTSSPIRATLPSTLSGGTYRFQIISTLTTVVSTTSTINVTALPTLTISGAGGASIIAGTQASVQVNFTGTPPWSIDFIDYRPGTAPNYTRSVTTSTSTAILNPILFTTSTYDKSFIKSFRDSGCGVSTAINGSAQITVTPIVLTTGSLSGTYCPGTTISVPFTTNSPLPTDAVCQVQLSDNNGNFQNGQTIGTGSRSGPITATLPQTLTSGTGYRLLVTVQNPVLQGAINYNDAISSTAGSLLISRPAAPRVTDISVCSGSVLSALTAGGTSLAWYADGSTQALAGAPVPASDRSSRYFVSQSVNGCESIRTALNVLVKPVPAAPVNNNTITLCQGAPGQISTTVPGALWYTSATGGTGTPQPPVVNNQAVGDQTFYLSQTLDGCESPRAAVKASVYAIPVAPTIQTPAPLCQYAVGIALSASGQNLTWYGQSGTLTAAPIPETSDSGAKSYSVTQKINGCESLKAVIEQVIRPAPTTPLVTSVRYCVGDVARSLTATGSNLKWYSTAIGGNSSTISPPFLTETPAVLTFYVTQTDNTNCESQRQPVSVSVVAPPSAPAVIPNQAVCQFVSTGPLTASPNIGLSWQGSGISGSSDTAPTPVTTQPATYTYLVTQRSGSCISPAAAIAFTVRRLPDPPTVVPSVAFCIGQASTALTAVATGQLTWYTAANRTGPSSSQVTVNTASASTTTYYVTQTDINKCESPNSTLTVRVSAKSTARLTGDDYIYTGDSTAIRVRLSGNGPWSFTNWSNQTINTTDSLYIKWEKPTATRTYTITNLSSTCGPGDILNSYTLTVKTPLSTQPTAEPMLLTAYPNPTTGDLFVDWIIPTKQPVDIKVINAAGKIIRQITRQATGQRQTELFHLTNQPAGIYFLRLITPQTGVVTKPILKR